VHRSKVVRSKAARVSLRRLRFLPSKAAEIFRTSLKRTSTAMEHRGREAATTAAIGVADAEADPAAVADGGVLVVVDEAAAAAEAVTAADDADGITSFFSFIGHFVSAECPNFLCVL
jgi:hypothetical protein